MQRLLDGLTQMMALTPTFPVTQAVAGRLKQRLMAGEPPFWKALSASLDRGYSGTQFVGAQLLANIHYAALADLQNPLTPFFPTCGGKLESGLEAAFDKFWDNPGGRFLDSLGMRRKSYLQPPGLVWAHAAQHFFGRAGCPFHVVEIACGLGANLIADHALEPSPLAPGIVQGRVGLDPSPMNPRGKEHQRWAVAALLPDQAAEAARLRTNLEWLEHSLKEDDTFLQLIPCSTVLSAKAIARSVPPRQDASLLIFGVDATGAMAPGPYQSLMADVDSFLKYWGPGAVWLESEIPKAPSQRKMELRCRRLVRGSVRSVVLGAWSSSGEDFDWLDQGWAEVGTD